MRTADYICWVVSRFIGLLGNTVRVSYHWVHKYSR